MPRSYRYAACRLVQSHYTLPDWREKSNSKVARVKVEVHPPKSKRKKSRLVTPTQVKEKEGEVGDTQVDGKEKSRTKSRRRCTPQGHEVKVGVLKVRSSEM